MGACTSLGSMCSLALFAALLTAQGLQQSTCQRRRSLPRAAASDDAEALLAAAASLRAEASQLEKEIAPPVAPPPPPPPRIAPLSAAKRLRTVGTRVVVRATRRRGRITKLPTGMRTFVVVECSDNGEEVLMMPCELSLAE